MGGNKQSKISTKVRHFSYTRQDYDGIQKFEDFPEDMHLRTFLALPIKDIDIERLFPSHKVTRENWESSQSSTSGYHKCEFN
ncbi:putative disease resistance rpp13-like protein 1 [Fagus crenata]